MINKNIPAKAFKAAKAIMALKDDKEAMGDLHLEVGRGDKDALDTLDALDILKAADPPKKEGK